MDNDKFPGMSGNIRIVRESFREQSEGPACLGYCAAVCYPAATLRLKTGQNSESIII